VIRQQIVPELRGEIKQAVTALRSSPTSTISPDSTNLSGTLSCPIYVNNSYNSDANAIHSVNDSLGLNVSQNLKEINYKWRVCRFRGIVLKTNPTP
jgi:hypothetical protein